MFPFLNLIHTKPPKLVRTWFTGCPWKKALNVAENEGLNIRHRMFGGRFQVGIWDPRKANSLIVVFE